MIKLLGEVGSAISKALSYVGSKSAGGSASSGVKIPMAPKNDFVMRPGQPAVNFSPDDTLIGIKNTNGLGGTTIVINGDNYGVNADEISDEILKKLRGKISL